MSSPTKDSPRPQTTSSGYKGDRTQYHSGTLPPAAHISYKPEMVGARYGWVEIINPEKRWSKNYNHCWMETQCTSCGSTQWTNLNNLQRGISKGCQRCSEKERPHIPRWLDRRLTAAKQRCTNPNDPNWNNYGARGIKFNFPSILEAGQWVIDNLGLHRDLELDRINNDGHYEPGNLRWANRQLNAANRRCVLLPEWNEKEWPYARVTVARKLASGLTREQILDEARKAVQEKRKNWREIDAKLASLTSSTPAPDTDSPSQAA